jgi:hypothetical protein
LHAGQGSKGIGFAAVCATEQGFGEDEDIHL